jgi:hypothetical protein
VLLAVIGQWDAVDVLHDEVRPAIGGGAAVEQARYVRVRQPGQYLPLIPEWEDGNRFTVAEAEPGR